MRVLAPRSSHALCIALCLQALGRLCAGLGEEHFPDLLDWLLTSLSSEGSTVERAGAAQGLAEVLSALGDAKVEQFLPTILDGCGKGTAASREGFSMLWSHLPTVLGRRFERFLPAALPVVLNGLADDAATVRDSAMRGAHAIIATYLEAAAVILLPPLQRGLADSNYRIRQSSAELLGSLMRRLTDGEYMEMLEEDAEPSDGSPLASVPVAQQHALLASLYIARNDVHTGVRSAASQVWKALVSAAPRMLRVILRSLTDQLISGLSDEDEDQQQASAQALGELVTKLSERVLPKLLPLLQSCLTEGGPARRRGVCLGLSELMAAAGKENVLAFLSDIIPCVRSGLCDLDEGVCEAAARAFSTLQRCIGVQAIHEIVPALLQLLRSDDTDRVAMGQSGLRQVMDQRPQAVVPYLLPKLLAPPIKLSHARALAAVAEVAGAALHPHLDTLVPALFAETYLEAEVAPEGCEVQAALRDALVAAADAVALAVEEDGLHYLISELGSAMSRKAAPHVRVAASSLTETLFKNCAHDLSSYYLLLTRGVTGMFHAEQHAVVRAGVRALDSFVKSVPKERYPLHVTTLREQIQEVGAEHSARCRSTSASREEAELLPALCQPEGLGPLVSVYLQGLMTGTPELREQSAAAIGEAVGLTSAAALKKYVIQITGPLIRIVGDRFPSAVKVAILHTLTLLVSKCALLLKPFVPQLQTTFVKALSDTTRQVRAKGAVALSRLVSLSTRVEALVTELHNTLLSALPDVQANILSALAGVIRGMPKPISDALLSSVQASALKLLGDHSASDDQLTRSAASLVGACAQWTALPEMLEALSDALGDGSEEDWQPRYRKLCCLLSMLRQHKVLGKQKLEPVLTDMYIAVEEAARSERIDLRQPACHGSCATTETMPCWRSCMMCSPASNYGRACAHAFPYAHPCA